MVQFCSPSDIPPPPAEPADAVVRPANLMDMEQLLRFVPLFSWREPESVVRDLASCLAGESGDEILVVEGSSAPAAGGRAIVAMGAWGKNPAFSNGWHLRLAGTLPEHRGLGHGGALIAARIMRVTSRVLTLGRPGFLLVSTRRPETFAKRGFARAAEAGGVVLMTATVDPLNHIFAEEQPT